MASSRWSGLLRIPFGNRTFNVAASLLLNPNSKALAVPAVNAIFFYGDRVAGTGNPVIETLSDSKKVAELLVSKLGRGGANVWVFEAGSYNGPFAVYSEFVPNVNSRGEPERYDPEGFPASSAIVSILSDCVDQVNKLISSNRTEQAREKAYPALPKTVVLGFSKGGIVLNQLVAEFSQCKISAKSSRKHQIYPDSKDAFLFSISEFHYVDVGLNCAGAYLIDQSVVKNVADLLLLNSMNLRFTLHGTPRQWSDRQRPWILKEKDLLLQLLKDETQRCKKRLRVTEKLYFANTPPSLQMHFEIIEAIDLS